MQKKPRHFAFNLLLQKILLFVAALAFLASPVVTLAANPTTPTGTTTTTQQQSTTPTTQQNLYTTPVNTQNTAQNTTQGANQAASTTQTTQKKQDVSQTCEAAAGPLSFFLCPAYTQITKGINWMAGPDDSMLTNLLRVQPLQFSKDTGLLRAYQNILVFANSLFVIVFLVIIFASLIRDFSFLDNYNLKSNLPRLIAAVILAQFGYLICSAAIDLGNIAGTLIPKTISAGVLGPNVPMPNLSDGIVSLLAFGDANSVGTGTATVTNLIFGGGSGIVFILLFLLALVAFFALLMALIYMVARVLILYMLVLAAPIAFLAFVLPGTQPFFFRWGRNLVRLVIMFPLVVGVVTIAEIVSFLLQHPTLDPNTFTDDRFKLLIGGLIPFVALFMIPKCLKASGDLTELTGGAIAGFVAGKVANKEHIGKARTWGKEGLQNSIAYNDNLNKTRFGRVAVAGLSGMSSKSPSATAKMGQVRDRAQSVYDKAAALGTSDELKAMLKQNYRPAKIAALVGLAKKGDRAAIKEALDPANGYGITKDLLGSATNKDFDAFKGMPDMRNYFDSDAKKEAAFSSISSKGFGDVSPSTMKDWLGSTNKVNGVDVFTINRDSMRKFSASQYRSFLGDRNARSSISVDIIREMSKHAHSTTLDPATSTAEDYAIQAAIQDELDSNGVWRH